MARQTKPLSVKEIESAKHNQCSRLTRQEKPVCGRLGCSLGGNQPAGPAATTGRISVTISEVTLT